MCNRHFGVGADGIILILSSISKNADFRMRIFNADGSEAEMCGNGIRCAAKYFWERIGRSNYMKVDTMAGLLPVFLEIGESTMPRVEVDMGIPRFKTKEIPILWGNSESLLDVDLDLHDIGSLRISAVNTGVPHTVVFVDDVDSVDVRTVGRALRYHKLFPKGTNVDFVEVLSNNHLKVRTYERGVEDETLCCGTGATAAASIAILLGKVKKNKEIKLEFRGGILYLRARSEGKELRGLTMIGTASKVFEGVYNPD
jgi:diaminopimelate epimerase